MRKQLFPLLFVSVIILSGAFAFPARATVYSPGVTPTQYVTLGHVTYSANGTLPPGFSQLNGTSSLTNTVTSVNAKNVTVQQYWIFNNGTLPKYDTVSGNVETGKGNLTLFVIAGGLTAGDPINQLFEGQNFFDVINQTVTREYAGAARTVNVVNSTTSFQQYFIKAAIYNDAATGFLLEFSESGHLQNSPTTSVTFAFDAVATTTNVWSPSNSPDFSFDAIPASSTHIQAARSVDFQLNLTSFQAFTGVVTITAGLIGANSTITNHVTVSPASSTVTVLPTSSATETLTVSSASSTPTGLYILIVNATAGALFHSDHLTVRVVSPIAPDFTITANPTTLQIPQGNSRISTITLTSQGGLSGTAYVSAHSTGPTNLNVSPTTTTVFLTPNGQGSFDLTMLAANNAPTTQYQVVVGALLGTSYHAVNIYPTVTSSVVGDFAISANPASLIIPQGHARYTNVTLTSLNSFSGTVSIGYNSRIRDAVDIGPSSETLISGGTQTFRVEIYVPLSTPVGNYYLNVSGTAQSTHTVKIPVQAVSSSLPGFNITITPTSQSITQGSMGTAKVTLRSLNGFQGTVTLRSFFSSLPTSFSPISATLLAGQTVDSTLTISPSNSVTLGVYPVDVEGQTNSTGAYDSIYTTITVTSGSQPDFKLTPTSTTITVVANAFGSDNLRVDAVNGFTGTVSFIRVGSPFGGVSYDCSSVTLSPTVTSGTSICTFSSSAPGTYNAIVNGTGGSPVVSHKVTYAITVIKASPSVSTTLSASTITVGGSVTDSATLAGTDLLTASGTITYQFFTDSTCTGTPTVVGSPVALAYGAATSQSQTFNTAGAFSWNAVYSGDADNNGATSSCEPLTVNAPLDYALTATPTSDSISAGSTFTATITAKLTGDVGIPVTLTVSNSPNPSVCTPLSGVSPCGTFSLSPTTITPTSSGSTSTLTISTTTIVPPGTYTITITGLPSGASSSSATITLTVTAPPPSPDFTLGPHSTSVSANPNTAVTSTLTVAPLNGFSNAVGLSLTVSPSTGLTCTLSQSSITSGSGTSTLSCTGVVGSYIATITGTSGSLSHTANVAVFIQYSATTGCRDGTCIIHCDTTISNVNLSGNTLHFQADGPSGTTGHANVTIPISSVPNKDNLKVFVDNSQLPSSSITIVSDSNNYYLSFSFAFHSPAQIDIQLTSPENAATPTILGLNRNLFYELIGGMGAVVVIIIAIVMVRRRQVRITDPQLNALV